MSLFHHWSDSSRNLHYNRSSRSGKRSFSLHALPLLLQPSSCRPTSIILLHTNKYQRCERNKKVQISSPGENGMDPEYVPAELRGPHRLRRCLLRELRLPSRYIVYWGAKGGTGIITQTSLRTSAYSENRLPRASTDVRVLVVRPEGHNCGMLEDSLARRRRISDDLLRLRRNSPDYEHVEINYAALQASLRFRASYRQIGPRPLSVYDTGGKTKNTTNLPLRCVLRCA